jgi:hypothetical protein
VFVELDNHFDGMIRLQTILSFWQQRLQMEKKIAVLVRVIAL